MKKIVILTFFVVFANWIIININEKINTSNTVISDSISNIRYENFIKYQDINDELIVLNFNLKKTSDVHQQEELKRKIANLEDQLSLLKELIEFKPNVENIEVLKASDKKLKEFEQALNFASVSYSVYEKKIGEELSWVSDEIKVQSLRVVNTLVIVIAMAFMLKFITKKYIKDNERYYIATKIINFINIIFLILLFAYIENIAYLITILGFTYAALVLSMIGKEIIKEFNKYKDTKIAYLSQNLYLGILAQNYFEQYHENAYFYARNKD
ncbi:mechanosensitive ion channel family protein [Campylobacter jejuni subsp. jejuni 414]|nr:mechanosensitive ion channel family protein [Campylobacter jejuni subsp. jejuni 414]